MSEHYDATLAAQMRRLEDAADRLDSVPLFGLSYAQRLKLANAEDDIRAVWADLSRSIVRKG